MRKILHTILVLLLSIQNADCEIVDPPDADPSCEVPAALGELLRYDGPPADPRADKVVRGIYIVPADRSPVPGFAENFEHSLLTLQDWFGRQVGGKSFKLADPPVVIYQSSKNAADFATDPATAGTGNLQWWQSVANEAAALAGSSYQNPNFCSMVVIDSDPVCGQVGGAGYEGLAIVGRGDLTGLLGQPSYDPCSGNSSTSPRCRWIGGMGHELGHALARPHAQAGVHDSAIMLFGYLSFPYAYLTPDDIAFLSSYAYFYPYTPTSTGYWCGDPSGSEYPFTMDGIADGGVCSTGALSYGLRDGWCYFSFPTTGTSDRFLFLAGEPGLLGPAPWTKSGNVAAPALSVAVEGTNSFCTWRDAAGSSIPSAPTSRILARGINATEVLLSLEEIPGTQLAFALAEYATADGGALIGQAPASEDGNGNVEAAEYFSYSDTAITCSEVESIPTLADGVPASGSVPLDTWRHYRMEVPAGSTELLVTLSGDNDADLYIRRGSLPTLGSWDFRPWLTGSLESVLVTRTTTPAITAGTYFISVHGYGTGTSAYTVTAYLSRFTEVMSLSNFDGFSFLSFGAETPIPALSGGQSNPPPGTTTVGVNSAAGTTGYAGWRKSLGVNLSSSDIYRVTADLNSNSQVNRSSWVRMRFGGDFFKSHGQTELGFSRNAAALPRNDARPIALFHCPTNSSSGDSLVGGPDASMLSLELIDEPATTHNHWVTFSRIVIDRIDRSSLGSPTIIENRGVAVLTSTDGVSPPPSPTPFQAGDGYFSAAFADAGTATSHTASKTNPVNGAYNFTWSSPATGDQTGFTYFERDVSSPSNQVVVENDKLYGIEVWISARTTPNTTSQRPPFMRLRWIANPFQANNHGMIFSSYYDLNPDPDFNGVWDNTSGLQGTQARRYFSLWQPNLDTAAQPQTASAPYVDFIYNRRGLLAVRPTGTYSVERLVISRYENPF